jgi:hypothetical protein
MPSLRIIEERQYVDDPDACQTKADLVTKYKAAVNEFNRTVNFLNKRIGTLAKKDYDDIRAWTEKTRLKVEQARVNLDQHIAGHHC